MCFQAVRLGNREAGKKSCLLLFWDLKAGKGQGKVWGVQSPAGHFALLIPLLLNVFHHHKGLGTDFASSAKSFAPLCLPS